MSKTLPNVNSNRRSWRLIHNYVIMSLMRPNDIDDLDNSHFGNDSNMTLSICRHSNGQETTASDTEHQVDYK